MPSNVVWRSSFTITRKPFAVAMIQDQFPLTPTESFDSDTAVLSHGDRYIHGMCAYQLPHGSDQSTWHQVLRTWIGILEPYQSALGRFREEGYACFLEIWTDTYPDDWWQVEFSHEVLQRLANLTIDLDLRIER